MSKQSATQVAIEAKHARPRPDHVSLPADAGTVFAAAFERRLCVVCAPAGYGKTTVTAAALELCGREAAWYKLDILDHDPLVFLASVIRAVQRRRADFGAALLKEIEAAPVAERSVEVLAAQFCSECDAAITTDFHLVLDDYHEAMASASMNDVLGYIVENCPPTLHFLVLTRYEPAFRLEKLNLAGQVLRLQRDLFVLDDRQAAEVLACKSGRTHDPDDVARLLQLTEGWAAAVVLAGMALSWLDVASLKEVLGDPRVRGDVFSYLAEQVFQRQTDDVRRFLLATCCLDHVTAELAEALTGSSRSTRHLTFLARNHIFTFDTERTGAYRYHNLLRDFLRQRFIQDEGESEFRALQRRTATALEDAGDLSGAVELLLAANELDLALGVIARGGEALLERRPSEQLRIWMERLSNSSSAGHPWALVTDAVLNAREGQFNAALRELREAAEQLQNPTNRSALYEVLSITEWAEFWSGDSPASIATSYQALSLTERNEQRLHTLLSIMSAGVDMRRWEDVAQASEEAERLMQHASEAEASRARALRAHAAFYRGDIRLAHRLLQGLDNPSQTIAQRASALNTLGMVEIACADFISAEAHLREALGVAENYGRSLTSHIEDNCALLDASLGHHDAAIRRLRSVQERSESLDPTMLCAILMHEATVLRRSGQVQESAELSRRALLRVSLERDPYLYYNTKANVAFSEGLLGHARLAHLRDVAVQSAAAGLAFVELKSTMLAMILADIQRANSTGIEECLERQLALGHLNVVAQELCPRVSLAYTILKRCSPKLGPPLLMALGRHWQYSRLSAFLSHNGGQRIRKWLREIEDSDEKAGSPVMEPYQSRSPAAQYGSCAPTSVSALTARELEVLDLMARDRSNEEIAAELFIALSTVKTHVNHILRKLEQKNRIGAILEYQRCGANGRT